MSNYTVSVIIPTFNSAKYIENAIESVLAQTLQNFELIIVDDGSTDQTRAVVTKYTKKDSRVRYIYQNNSGGAAAPKNTGIRMSNAEYIAVLDADDQWMPSKLERQVRLLSNSSKNLGFVGCDYVVNDSSGAKKVITVNTDPEHLQNILMRDFMGPGSCIMYKSEVFDKVGHFDECLKTSQDWEMRIRLSQFYEFDTVPEPLVVYLIHSDNISKSKLDIREQDRQNIFNKYINHYKNDSYLMSRYLRYQATFYLSSNETSKARNSIIKSIKTSPLRLEQILVFVLSLISADNYKILQNIYVRMGNLKRKLSVFLKNNLKNPKFFAIYVYGYFLPDFKIKVLFYTDAEVKKKLEEGFSLIRLGDGEVSVMLQHSMPYHNPNKELARKMAKMVKEFKSDKRLLVAVPKQISLSSSKLKQENKKTIWLPFKVMFTLFFDSEVKYVDAHSFYNETIFNYIINNFLCNKNVIVVTKKETINRMLKKIGLNTIFVPSPEFDAYSDYLRIEQEVSSAIDKLGTVNTVVIFALGPVGKIMAYDLHKRNIQCIDVGKGLEKFSVEKYV